MEEEEPQQRATSATESSYEVNYNQLYAVPEETSDGRSGSLTSATGELDASALLGWSHVNRRT